MVNMSSTAVGSTATYQCRDGPTDVYTTQCISTGVWDPLSLSTLDCTKSVVPGQHCMCLLLNKPVFVHNICVPHTGKTVLEPYQVGVIILSVVVLVETMLLVGALVKIVFLTKRSETKTLQYLSTIIGAIQHRVRAENERREVGDGCKCGIWCT